MREFDTREITVAMEQLKSSRKKGIAEQFKFKTKGPYIILKKAIPGSYCMQGLYFIEGIGSPGRKFKTPTTRMDNIPSIMVLHKHVDVSATIFATILVPLVNKPMETFLGVIKRGNYQAYILESRW